jgi:hypothetical protein
MLRFKFRRFIAAALALSVCGWSFARAQVIWDMPNIVVQPPKFKAEGPARPDVWPRLDKGAVFCKTEPDLIRLAASRRGEPVERPNCQVIRGPTAIQIVRRAAPGRTLVSIADQNDQEGWTDAWLPDRAPAPTGKGVVIR